METFDQTKNRRAFLAELIRWIILTILGFVGGILLKKSQLCDKSDVCHFKNCSDCSYID